MWQFRVWQRATAEFVSAPPCSMKFCGGGQDVMPQQMLWQGSMWQELAVKSMACQELKGLLLTNLQTESVQPAD